MAETQTLVSRFLGSDPNQFPTVCCGGHVSPSPQWQNGPEDQEVTRVRKKAFAEHGVSLEETVWMAPKHSAKVRFVDSAAAGAGAYDRESRIECDAMVTMTRNLYLVGVSADCPVWVIEDHQNGVLALGHSGWAGLQKRIIPKTVQEMKHLGAQSKHMDVFVGPFITEPHYHGDRWGPREAFFFEYGALYQKAGMYYCNMETVLRKQFEEQGIPCNRLTFDGRDPYEDSNLESHVRTREDRPDLDPAIAGFQRGSNVMFASLPS